MALGHRQTLCEVSSPSKQIEKLWLGDKLLQCVNRDRDLGDMTLIQGHDTPSGHEQ